MTEEMAARFWGKVSKEGLFGCWIWTGAYSQKARGRPARPIFWICRIRIDGTPREKCPQLIVPAARMALALTDGVPLHDRAGLEACHRPQICDNPSCVNPAHLYWGTPEENRADRYPQLRAQIIEGLGSL